MLPLILKKTLPFYRLVALYVCLAVAPTLNAAMASGELEFEQLLRGEDAEAIRAHIEAGGDPNFKMPAGKTPLIVAAKIGDPKLVQLLLDLGSDVNAATETGGTALMFAAIRGNLETVELLIGHGADVNATAHFNWTALMVAAVKGHDVVVRVLLDHGANANVADTYGWTPLMRAAYENRTAAVRALTSSGKVNLDAVDESGFTALHHAAARGHVEIARLLLDNGADIGARSRERLTPVEVARRMENEQTVRFLESRGAR